MPLAEISCSYKFEFETDDEESDYSLADSLSDSTDGKFGIDELTKVVILKVMYFLSNTYFDIFRRHERKKLASESLLT